MSDLANEVKQLAESKGLKFKDLGNGHLQIRSETNVVSYYPDSKKQTAYSTITGKKLLRASPADAVELCFDEPDTGEHQEWKSFTTNPAGIKNHYEGEAPPWDFPTLIASDSDRKRIAAYRLRRRADDLEENADAQERRQQTTMTPLQQAAREIQAKHGLVP